MFTIKVMRRCGDTDEHSGDERTDLYYSAHPSIRVVHRDSGPPQRVVTWREPGTDEWPAVVLDPDAAHDPPADGFIAHTVIVENEAGKTTEVVRA